MPWFLMGAEVPNGTQMVAVEAPSKAVAIKHAAEEVRKKHDLPKSKTIMPRILTTVDTQEEAQRYMDRLHQLIEEEDTNNAQA